MKILYPLIGMVLCASSMNAADGYRTLNVSLNDGSKVEVELSEKLCAMFVDDDFVITGGDAEITVPKAKIESFSFAKEAGVGAVGTDSAAPRFEGGSLRFDSLPVNSVVTVSNLYGQILARTTASGSYSMALNTLSKGVILVNVNGLTYKIAVK